ncbi:MULTISPECIES: efflux RND transporter periplasmic adaptor subunit [unclassified Caballeronia]|uniref:efflux RND transporter periplasmic adaptor subunit n=1 Tax=unclassified Caballeronia TaxID=2646786 RepID=UPI002866F9BA|nr:MULTISPECIES: efflux RND transporter periplasmic adaptor subunit [unclassified Caballeronia]MDR5815295.1 efflux RND transporter periplasmic adaptor subunit [Caballeronia sp. LZ033]MDR5822562.1 efflux RND transporter periplasmic adaptor subunit [Caballeronia sp. LZ043]MDR5880024.1 efflux RND transporter periplasmic adaptor subunit [Caballeronia sp. LZ032]
MRHAIKASPRALALLAVALLVLLTLWALLFRTVEHVDTVAISRGDIQLSVTALGTLQPHSYVDIGAQASGEIRRITVQPGDTVKKGQLLVEIDPSVQQARYDVDASALKSLRARLEGEQAKLAFAQHQYERQRRMMSEGSTREEDLQSALSAWQSGRSTVADLTAEIDGARATLQGDEAQLGYTKIYAPMSGTIVTLDAREGQTLNATYQTPIILRIADLSTMTVWTQVSEADVLKVKPGMPVWFTTLGADTRWNGTVRQVLPAPPNTAPPSGGDQQAAPNANAINTGKVVSYTVLFDVKNQDNQLLPQMSAQVFFVAQEAHDVPLAPLSALTPVAGSSDRYRARVLADGRVVTRDVRVGVHDRLNAEIRSGLAPGERLVTGIRRVRGADGKFEW